MKTPFILENHIDTRRTKFISSLLKSCLKRFTYLPSVIFHGIEIGVRHGGSTVVKMASLAL